nr:MAG TPA: hypothetical protein [Caudoviricetes sp.]
MHFIFLVLKQNQNPRGRAIISKALLNAGLFVWLSAYLVGLV